MCAADSTCEITASKSQKYVVDLVGLRQHHATNPFKTRRVRRRGASLNDPLPPRVRDVKSGSWLDLTARPSYWTLGPKDDVGKRQDLPLSSPVVQKISEWMNSTIRTGHAAAYGQVPGGGGPTLGME